MANKNLTAAKKAKNDEFYTQLSDIEKELCHYKHHFKDKVVLCNCDDPVWSNFWRYFHLNFAHFGLKKLIATHYDANQSTYKMEYCGYADDDVYVGDVTPLTQNGDFRNQECIDLLKEADIVVTNPPFSLFREYVEQLMKYDKKFIIIGNKNAVTYKEFFPLLKNDLVWLGVNSSHGSIYFGTSIEDVDVSNGRSVDKKCLNSVPAFWYTNLDIPKRHEPIDLIEHYTPEKYPTYDNYDAINVDKTLDIPCDYDGVMGVPISFLDKYCPEQFEIVGMDGQECSPAIKEYHQKKKVVDGKSMKSNTGTMGCVIRESSFGKGTYFDVGYPVRAVYKRIFIRRKQ